MQSRFRIPLVIVFLVLLTASCSKKNKEGKYVPKDAAIVVHVNGASLSSKLPWEEVKKNELFQELSGDTSIPSFVKQALDNPDNSGIDSKADLLFFLKKDTLGGYAAFTGTVKDAEKFKLFNLDMAKDGVEGEQDGVNFISKYPVCVGWNKERFVYLVNIPEMNEGGYKWRSGGNTGNTNGARDIHAACKTLFDIKESNSLAEDEKFTALVKQTGDIHFWMNAGELYRGSLSAVALPMLDINKLYEGSISAVTVNFEAGKILIDGKSYANKEITALWKKYGKNVDESMLKRLPAKEVAAAFAISFKPEGLKEFLKVLGVEGYANMGLAFLGFTFEDFVKANKGDIVLALTDFTLKPGKFVFNETADSTAATSPKPEVLFATSIGDKDAFNKLVKAGERMGKNFAGTEESFAYNSNGNLFAIGNSKENVDKYISGGSNNFDFVSKISGQPFGGYINLQYILKTFESEAGKDSAAKVVYDASVKFWDKIYMKGGDYSDGGTTSSATIELMDKTTNSAKQLNQYLGIAAKIGKQKSDENKARIKMEMSAVDTLRRLPPPPPPSLK